MAFLVALRAASKGFIVPSKFYGIPPPDGPTSPPPSRHAPGADRAR